MKKTFSASCVIIALAITLFCCTTVKTFTGVDLSQTGFNLNLFNDIVKKPQPVSTSFEHAVKERVLPDDFGDNMKAHDLAVLPRTAEGGIILRPGLYETYCKSFCLRAGTHAPSKGDGYLYAPLQGTRGDIVRSVLRSYSRQAQIAQGDVQYLLWAIIARADFKNMSPELKATATKLLTPKELFELNGGVVGLVPDKLMSEWKKQLDQPLQHVVEAENKIREMVSRGVSSYQAYQDIAILPGAAPVDKPEYKRGRWCLHPAGFYIRFFPEGFQRTKVQVYLPDGGIRNGTGRSVSSIVGSRRSLPVVDLSSIIAVPANTGAQRIGICPPPSSEVPDSVGRKLPECFKKAMEKFGIYRDSLVRYFTNYRDNRSGGNFFRDIDALIANNPWNIDECDAYALWGYTTNLFYWNLNQWLRERLYPERTAEITRMINEVLNKLPNYPGRNIYRGVAIPAGELQAFLNRYRSGNRNVWEGFISCGGSLDGSFAGRPNVNVIFEIEHLTGKDISQFADGIRYGGMPPPEVMIRDGRNFESLGDPVFDAGRGRWIIRVRQLN